MELDYKSMRYLRNLVAHDLRLQENRYKSPRQMQHRAKLDIGNSRMDVAAYNIGKTKELLVELDSMLAKLS